jgi:hypothetical protein
MGTRKNPRKTLTPKRSAPLGRRNFESILSEKNPPDKQGISSSEFIPHTDDSRYLPVPLNTLKIVALLSHTTLLGKIKSQRKRLGNQAMVIKVRVGEITPVVGKGASYAFVVRGPKRRQVNRTPELIIKCSLIDHPEQIPCSFCKTHGVQCSGGKSSNERRSMKVPETDNDMRIVRALLKRHGQKKLYELLEQAVVEVQNEQSKPSVREYSPERTS